MNRFSKRIRELREEAELTQKELAKIINVSESQIGNIESGLNETRLSKAVLLAKHFNVTLEYLVGVSDTKSGTGGLGTTVLPEGSPERNNAELEDEQQ